MCKFTEKCTYYMHHFAKKHQEFTSAGASLPFIIGEGKWEL